MVLEELVESVLTFFGRKKGIKDIKEDTFIIQYCPADERKTVMRLTGVEVASSNGQHLYECFGGCGNKGYLDRRSRMVPGKKSYAD